MRCRRRRVAGICGPGRSGTTTRWKRRCAGCWLPGCCPGGPGSRSRRWCISPSRDLCQLDAGSALQAAWIAGYRARWAAHRAAASVATGDGGAWLDGDQARAAACDAMIIPVVTGDIDAAAVEDLIALCVPYHRLRTTPAPAAPGHDGSPSSDGSPGSDSSDGSPGSAVVGSSPGADSGNTAAAPPSRPG